MQVVFLGAPGSGKGTQAKRLAQKFGLEHISTGDILREAIKKNTELGQKARNFMDAGELVPDDVMLGIIKEELLTKSAKGFIFDGFPRTTAQAEGLDKMLQELGLSISKVINLNVPDEVIVNRLESRVLCADCGTDYNIKIKPPRIQGKCDVCGNRLYRRPDDAVDIIENRLKVYRKKTKPIEDFYRSRGLLAEVDGNRSCEDVFNSIAKTVAG
jgi:adenylate kinase